MLELYVPILFSGVKGKKKGKKNPRDGPPKIKDLFSGDGTGKVTKPGARGAKGAKGSKFTKQVDSGGMVKTQSKTEMNRLKRGGKGKSSFKSKSRFKRK